MTFKTHLSVYASDSRVLFFLATPLQSTSNQRKESYMKHLILTSLLLALTATVLAGCNSTQQTDNAPATPDPITIELLNGSASYQVADENALDTVQKTVTLQEYINGDPEGGLNDWYRGKLLLEADTDGNGIVSVSEASAYHTSRELTALNSVPPPQEEVDNDSFIRPAKDAETDPFPTGTPQRQDE